MADIAVSVSTGVMNSLLEKLAMLMGDECKKLIKGLRKEVSFLERELSDMNALLEKMDDADKLDPQDKKWRKDIIEMSYDIEDYIDDFLSRVGEASNNVGLLHKAYHYLKTFIDRHRLAGQFQEIKTRLIEAAKRRRSYKFDQCIPSTTQQVNIDPRISLLHKSSSLVGIDSQKEAIMGWAMDEEQELKVMSIVGFGGLGKTTLANEVYREVGGEFNCKAFVSISQNPDIIKLLNSLMLQLGLQPYSHACELQDLINNIVQHLHGKRYFIIVDDLWDIRAWDAISCAFPRNNHHSRVMITTRIEDLAIASCENHGYIHHMKPLDEQDSRKLFFDRICESEDACPPDFIEVSHKILKKCGGLPLAIITMASMIACQPKRSMGKWAEYIQNSLAAEFATKPKYEDMLRIIDFSYKNLPRNLKACFLYLGTYPEDHKISRVELVRRWLAEGFVSCSRGQDAWDVAESYFSELANRSMIQPAYEDFDNVRIKITHCRVHDMMLELILRKCREDNFISFVDAPERIPEDQYSVIRRLTFDLRGAEVEITVRGNTRQLSQVRSLNIFGGNFRIPNIAEFKFMRLLFLDVGNFKTVIDLCGIKRLPLLSYLMVRGDGNKVLLPAQIRGLRFLETLDLSELSCRFRLPEIVDVPRFSHVFVPSDDELVLPDGIGKVKSLLTLSGFSLLMSSLESIKSLGELTALSELFLTSWKTNINDVPSEMELTCIDVLITSLEKLSNLRNLQLRNAYNVYCGDAMLGSSFLPPPFRKIEQLDLDLLIFSNVPRWIGHLHCLRELLLRAKQIHQEDINIIGTRLTSLVSVDLCISVIPTERIVIGGSTGFKVLKNFRFDGDGVSCLTFEAGAMPDLQLLGFVMNQDEWDKATPVGLQHLPSLKKIELSAAIAFTDELKEETKALMRGVFQEAAEALPTRPAVDVMGWTVRPQVCTCE